MYFLILIKQCHNYLLCQIEFFVQIKGEECFDDIRKSLNEHVSEFEVDLKLKKIIVKSSLPWYEIQKKIENNDRRVVLAGYGSKSAVATIFNNESNVRGVIRIASTDDSSGGDSCVIDGTVDGLPIQTVFIDIHESGDLSQVIVHLY